ncbi:hypothetical protein [Sandarakinorhabdus sp. DWP1-3-1]|uniref:hypothetical protein n=1 Tax=Sandarakinorhabdus sp. DWP1-3-1 TaxID=2804627 RepID=UPI003CF7C30D
MAITAASVETNGWVLRLVVTGGLGSFASYALDPDGTPRVGLSAGHAGFMASGGVAIPSVHSRTLIGTKPLRKPANWNGTGLDPSVIDEVDLGGGSIAVRIALSEYAYATDTLGPLAVLAGWRSGEAAASGIAVANNSSIAAPLPIMRWARPSYDIVNGSFRLSLLVASHHPLGFTPVAAVKFTATDGTNTKTVWTTALDTDHDHGDNLRCYTVTIDPATATALTAGLLRCDAEVYPWLGAMRSTDPAGTRSMAALGTAGIGAAAAIPFVIGYDPAGTRYGGRFIYVNPASTQTTSNATMVKSSLAAAKAEPLSNQPGNLQTAFNAIYNLNRSQAAANGQAASARAGDGITIVLAAGINVSSTSNAVLGVTTADVPIRVIGDPDNANPRDNCILRGPGASNGGRVGSGLKVRLANLTVQGTALGVVSGGTGSNFWYDNVIFKAAPGYEGTTGSPTTAVTHVAMTRVKSSQNSWRPYVSMLMRSCAFSSQIACPAIIRQRYISAEEDGYISTSRTEAAMVAHATGTNPAGLSEDTIVAFSDFRSLRGRGRQGNPTASAAAAGTPNPSLRRMLWLNNIFEKIGPTPDAPFYALGEDESLTMSYNIIEGNTFVGDRCNSFYSDPLPTTVAETNSQRNQAYVNRFANNYLNWQPSKHDTFQDGTTAGLRGNGDGYRPQMVEAWSYLYAVNHEATAEGSAAGSAFGMEFYGLRALKDAVVPATWFTLDRSANTGGSGGGDYRPPAGSPLLGRIMGANSDRDFADAPRVPSGASGALEAIGGAVGLVPAGSLHDHRAAAALAGWNGALAPADGHHAVRAGSPGLSWSAMLQAGAARSTFGGAGPALSSGPVLLSPDASWLDFGDLPAVLLVPAGIPGTIRTLRVGGDERTIVVKFN